MMSNRKIVVTCVLALAVALLMYSVFLPLANGLLIWLGWQGP
jgi:hypothetical protein